MFASKWSAGRDPGEAGMTIENDIVRCLTDDLRRAPYKGHTNPLRGHCYVASEALYHLKGGKLAGLKPMFIQHEGAPHWFLADTKNKIYIDLTSNQFETPVPYHLAKGKGFLTAKPSARAAKVMQRVQNRNAPARDPKYPTHMVKGVLCVNTVAVHLSMLDESTAKMLPGIRRALASNPFRANPDDGEARQDWLAAHYRPTKGGGSRVDHWTAADMALRIALSSTPVRDPQTKKPTAEDVVRFIRYEARDRDFSAQFARAATYEVADRFGISDKEAYRLLSQAAKQGLVHRAGRVGFHGGEFGKKKAGGFQLWELSWT